MPQNKLHIIKERIENYLINKILYLLKKNKNKKEQLIRNSLNVFIDESFNIDFQSHFKIDGTCQKVEIHKNSNARKFCNFLVYNNATLIIGENVFFNNYCSLSCFGHVQIGKNTMFGEGVKIYDHNHKYEYDRNSTLQIELNELNVGRIIIGENCWIGSNVTILNNVVIGDNVIIGANCLIYKSIPSNSIVKHQENLIIKKTIITDIL